MYRSELKGGVNKGAKEKDTKRLSPARKATGKKPRKRELIKGGKMGRSRLTKGRHTNEKLCILIYEKGGTGGWAVLDKRKKDGLKKKKKKKKDARKRLRGWGESRGGLGRWVQLWRRGNRFECRRFRKKIYFREGTPHNR